jgi:hypothetical protein
MLLLRVACVVVALVVAMVIQRWLSRRWLTIARVAQVGLAAVGVLAAAWLVWVEVAVFRVGCPPCLVASGALLAGFVVACLRPDWRRLGAVAVLCVGALGYLFPFGTIPKIFAVAEPAPAADGLSTGRLRGRGTVLVQEFGDFQCPACAQMDRILEQLLERNEDRLRLVFRHLPLRSIHPWAEPAALASECAARQGSFWTTKRMLFSRQPELGGLLSDPGDPSWGVPDPEAFRDCIEGRDAEAAVDADVAEARRLGLRSTPSVLIGQMLVIGSTSISRLEAVLEVSGSAVSLGSTPLEALGAAATGCGEGEAAPCSESLLP